MAFSHSWKSWLQLARISALPTALSNVLVGYLLVTRLNDAPLITGELVFLLIASACLYSAGMILNDVFDIEIDRRERPERPLPSGRIERRLASRVGFAMLALGTLAAGAAGWWVGPNHLVHMARPILVAGFLSMCIVAYNQWLKRTPLAPFVMGTCRFLNVLLGASPIFPATAADGQAFQFAPPIVMLGVSLGIYVTGITWLARKEAVVNSRKGILWLGTAMIAVGILGFIFTACSTALSHLSRPDLVKIFPWLLALVSVPVLRRAIVASTAGTPRTIQSTVVSGLRTIIVFDAAFCFLAAPDRPGYALIVMSLLIPSIVLSLWLKPT